MNSRNSDDGLAMGGKFDAREGGTKWQLLFFELFVVISLSVAYFFLVRNYIATGDRINRYVFTAGSEKCYRLDQPIMGVHWNGRLAGLLLSGTVTDFSVNEDNVTPRLMERINNVFGLYYTFWLLLLFVAVILALRHSLFINLGIFAGLMYNFSPASGPYFYPWDLPATLFFTLAVLLFERRQMWWMAVATCVGCFFKETVLVCALLTLFASHWKWGKRILTFVGIVAVYVLGKKLLLSQLHLEAAMLSMGDAMNLRGWLSPAVLMENLVGNLKVLFSPTLNSVLFANAGTLVAVLVLGWRRRFLPYMAVILAFLAGLVLLPLKPPGISEVRVFMQILPLSLILLSEWWMAYAKAGIAGEGFSEPAPAWAVRKTFRVLIPMTIVLIGLSTGVAARQYCIIFADLRQSQSELGKYKLESIEVNPEFLRKGYADAELELARISEDKRQFSEAIDYLKRALELDTNSVSALNGLAFFRATAPDPSLRDGKEAVRLAERACQQTQYKEVVSIRNLAAAYAEAGRFDDAVATAQKALAMALAQGPKELAAQDEQLLELYKSGQAYHIEAQPAP
jgi:tetratricopeptide (TPR) repeat protein